MNNIKFKPSEIEINHSFVFLNIASGKAKTPDYIGYSNATRELESQPLRPDEFEREKKRLAERYGI